MKTILIADDDKQNLYLLTALLTGHGYKVVSAMNGSEALKIASVQPPDLVISDILMPVMDGFVLCREWQANKHLKSVPFIFYTATYTDPKDKELALGLGAIRFIIKPEEPEQFMATIEKVLQNFTTADISSSRRLPVEEETYLKKYNERLVKKLEQKMLALEKEISERKQTERALFESEKKYRILFDNAREAIFVIQDGRIQFSNPMAGEILGISFEKITQTPFIDYVYPEDRAKVSGWHDKQVRGERVTETMPFRVVRSNGEIIWVHLNSVYFTWHEKPATLNFARDITQEKNLESQLRHSQKLEAMGTLAGGIAHDFNNILTAIIGYSEIARAQLPATDVIGKDLDKVITAGKRAAELVEQILTFSRREGEDFKPIEIQFIIKEALKLLRASLPATIELVTNIHRDGNFILADPIQLHQVLMNLCTNAKQAIGEDVGTLKIALSKVRVKEDEVFSACPLLDCGPYLDLEISDTGGGMDEMTLSKIFEPFFTTKGKGEGTGLGLAVVHGIVKQHKGEITVNSELGKGATFHIYLPVIKNVIQKVIEDNEDVTDTIPQGKGERILLVDDETEIVEMLQRLLNDLGYSVAGFNSSAKALEIFSENPKEFDLLITDMTMPEMTGMILSQKILAIRPNLPVILCTGFSETVDDAKAQSIGIQLFMSKPTPVTVLAKSISALLHKTGSPSK